LKARELAKKKAEKAAAAPKKEKASQKETRIDLSDLNPNQYFEM
jgi:hypothetical protein